MLAMSHPRKLVSVLYKKRKFADTQGTQNKERFKNWSPLYEGVGQLATWTTIPQAFQVKLDLNRQKQLKVALFVCEKNNYQIL